MALEYMDEGQFGKVYKVKHPGGDLLVCKIAKPDPLSQRLMAKEKKVYALGFDHPNIITAYPDVGGEDRLYMEEFHGCTFEDYIQQNWPSLFHPGAGEFNRYAHIHNSLTVVNAVAKALLYMRNEKMIISHCDVKPTNILVRDDKFWLDQQDVKLIDMAGVITGEQYIKMLETGSEDFIVDLNFVSPEAVDVNQVIETNSDVFCLGATLFYALSNMPNPAEGIRGIMPSERRLYRDLGTFPLIKEMAFKMLKKDPRRRITLEETITMSDEILDLHQQDFELLYHGMPNF